ncbi:MAG: TRAP transporter large permease [Nitrospinae bacterium]|nr:TRAP transporter large permease [Nitrospinota bacterium]
MNALILVLLFFFFLAFNTPIALALVFTCLFYLTFLSEMPVTFLASIMIGSLEHYSLIAIPLFIFAAQIMNIAKVTDRIFDFAKTLVGHFTGSLGHANIVASIIFAGMSGSALADAAGLGRVEIEGMTKEGYDKPFSAAVTAASSCIGPIIPPSIIMVIYASIAEESAGRVFLGGVIPGFFMGGAMMVIVYFISRKRGYKKYPRASLVQIWKSFRSAFLALMTPAIILGGIGSGATTPTEAAVLAVAWSLFLGMVVYKEVRLTDIPRILSTVIIYTAVVLFIFSAASVFTRLITIERVPFIFAHFLMTALQEKWLILFVLNIFLLIGGMVMEPTPLLLIVTPVMLPIAQALDIDLVHLGVFMVLNLVIGNLTPPFALALYVVSDITKVPFWTIVRATTPFYIPLIVTLFAMVYYSPLVMWLPNLLLPVN